MAEILDKYCDIILVGDSVGMSLYGMESTKLVKFDTMLLHGKTVKKFAKRSLVVFDMPYKTYSNKSQAYKNAKKVLKITGCDAVKLEGGEKVVNIVKYLTNKKIPVMGHIGLLPQSTKKFKLKGKNSFEKKKILRDGIALAKAGAFAIVIECVVESLAKEITANIEVPTIGIGASKHCDGQILVIDDIIGLSNLNPKRYSKDVKRRKFPSSQHVYKL